MNQGSVLRSCNYGLSFCSGNQGTTYTT